MDVPFISHNNLEFQMHVIDPNNVEPTINQASAEHRDGRQVHRRILSPIKGGPASIDVGFNRTAEGIDYAVPYAYNRDEFCYTAGGSARMQCDGRTVDFLAGQFMWRPAGAATQRFTVTSAYNSICAFGPARVDGWSHILPEDYHRKSDLEDERPQVQFRSPEEVEPRGDSESGVTHRIMFDTPHMEFSHIVLEAGAEAHLSRTGRDEVYFLEAGAFTISASEGSKRVKAGQFLFIPADEQFDLLRAEQNCVVIHWSAPASVG